MWQDEYAIRAHQYQPPVRRAPVRAGWAGRGVVTPGLPLPAPGSAGSGPAGWVPACRCGSVSSAKSVSMSMLAPFAGMYRSYRRTDRQSSRAAMLHTKRFDAEG